ncbi:hypothetical protein AB0L00_26555 [Actinoallomurus sp. NPDC052308]|uniref:hypothetical protein n=1 Tax=Actinoallomurus sp. NPDC052308 TaxID=3155530 RepID=UPI00341A626A
MLLVVLSANTTSSASAAVASHDSHGRFGIRLLEAPVARRKDPRAYYQIVDHIAPGTTIHRRILVENASARRLRVQLYVGAAQVLGHRFIPLIGRTPNELTTWTSLDEPSLDLSPHGEGTARVTIKVPPSASHGERYGVVWAQAEAAPDARHNLGAINRVGIRTYLDIGPGGEPASDFQITSLTPARGKDGRPEVLAQVRNTGGRVLEMGGALTLSDGPGKMSAGPFAATLGTTLVPGDSAPVSVVLDPRLPSGPWKARLTLQSGMIKRTVSATLTFPAVADTAGSAIRLSSSRLTDGLMVGGAVPAVVLALWLLRRHRPRRRS